MQDPTADHSYESDDETLSLCDLPLCTHQQTLEKSHQYRLEKSQESSFISTSKLDYFEFSSPSAPGFPPESFIFCGKVITEKTHKEAANPAEENLKAANYMKKNFGSDSIRSWMLRPGKKGTTVMHKDQSSSTKERYNNMKQEKKRFDYQVRQMTKARWYHLLWPGIPRFSSREVELREIKSRLTSRRHSQLLPPAKGGPRLPRMIGLLSCSGENHHPNTMVVKSTRSTFDF